ncbi:hypothetical protein HELRODRAFT_160148 [Helobdella robusta]|uniref:Endonuclease/exonuclease/phosphatase domain-containing protein n=1 Tax=Helobdella robusta TaxID=6412 RepID=T1EPW0_HELRO|nr:hypothetical protein HELRODRAFT_160148 [Helobdella robusta]ESO06033.1 hypothetical protein HELRODRAFT_160148 [Helobdella robusta]
MTRADQIRTIGYHQHKGNNENLSDDICSVHMCVAHCDYPLGTLLLKLAYDAYPSEILKCEPGKICCTISGSSVIMILHKKIKGLEQRPSHGGADWTNCWRQDQQPPTNRCNFPSQPGCQSGVNGEDINIVNIYIPPQSVSPSGFAASISTFLDIPNVAVLGDMNAHVPLWYSGLEDSRGEALAWEIENSECGTLNTDTPTRWEQKLEGNSRGGNEKRGKTAGGYFSCGKYRGTGKILEGKPQLT